jgi:hypothetical protein
MNNYQPPPPPPSPEAWTQPQYVATEPGKGFAVAALVLGITGIVFGTVPITGLIAVALGLTGFVLGVISWRKRSRLHLRHTMAAWGTILSAIALALGIWGMVIVTDTVNEIDRDLNELDQQIDDESYTPPSAAEIDQASDDELFDMWAESPSGSDIEAELEAELDARDAW